MIGFPRTINEKAARTVAGVVAVTGLVALLVPAHWLVIPLAYGFWARVLTGPRLSPLAALASRVVAPRLGEPREVPGPPKRFAQGMGAVMTLTAALLALGFDQRVAAYAVLGLVIVAATLESVFGYCVGCKVFAGLMRLGLIPASVCADCADITRRSNRMRPTTA